MATARPYPPPAEGLDRRSWLRIGGLSLGALVSGQGPSLARLFAAEENAARRGRALGRDFSVILFWANDQRVGAGAAFISPRLPARGRPPAPTRP